MKRRRFLINDYTYPIFITTTTVNWIPVFAEKTVATESLKMLESLRDKLKSIIYGYVLMPNHLHVMIQSSKRGDISELMRKWKSKTAVSIRNFSKEYRPDWLNRFSLSARKYNLTKSQTYQIWQPRFDEKAVRGDDEFLAKLSYMHGNPIKHNLVDDCGDYPYSSFADYNGGKNDFVSVECGHNKL